jgi:hypothetical protein
MAGTVSDSEARADFGRVMRDVMASGEPLIVASGDVPQVVICPFHVYEELLAGQRARPVREEPFPDEIGHGRRGLPSTEEEEEL